MQIYGEKVKCYRDNAVFGLEDFEVECAEKNFGANFIGQRDFEKLGMPKGLVPVDSGVPDAIYWATFTDERCNFVVAGTTDDHEKNFVGANSVSEVIPEALNEGAEGGVWIASASPTAYFAFHTDRFDYSIFQCIEIFLVRYSVVVFNVKSDVMAVFSDDCEFSIVSRRDESRRRGLGGESVAFWNDKLRSDFTDIQNNQRRNSLDYCSKQLQQIRVDFGIDVG